MPGVNVTSTSADLNELSLTELAAMLHVSGSARAIAEAARNEDLADTGDVTTDSLGLSQRIVSANVVSRADGCIAGLCALPDVLDVFDGQLTADVAISDGHTCSAGRNIATLHGPLHAVLAVERSMLNFLARLSGIATLTRQYVDATAHTSAAICDTRKTTPGWRHLEKYAVRCGGGTLHRMGLYDAALYKDNHLAQFADGDWLSPLAHAIERVRSQHELAFVEVEVDDLDQLRHVLTLSAGLIDIVLLDNMSCEDLSVAVTMRDAAQSAIKLEASGGITLETVRDIAETGVERIAVGALTHDASWLDIGLDMDAPA